MLTSHLEPYLGSYRWGFLVAAVATVGCDGGNQISCPAVLESCPATPPTFGAPCAARGSAAICEYGEDPLYDCNTVAFCDPTLVWHVFQTNLGGLGCPTTLPSACPPSFAELAGGQTGCASASEHITCRYPEGTSEDRKSTRLNSSHVRISYADFCLKKKKSFAGASYSSHQPDGSKLSYDGTDNN